VDLIGDIGVSADDLAADVGAMVGYTLEIGEHFEKYNAAVNVAQTVLKAFDVLIFEGRNYLVDGLLKRLYLISLVEIVALLRFAGYLDYLVYRAEQYIKIVGSSFGERNIISGDIDGRFHNVGAVVTDPLVIAGDAEMVGDKLAFVVGGGVFGKLDQIVGKPVLHLIDEVFGLIYLFNHLGVITCDQRNGVVEALMCIFRHVGEHGIALRKCKSGRDEQAFLKDVEDLFAVFTVVTLDRNGGQLFNKACKRNKCQRYGDVEDGVEVCYITSRYRIAPEGGIAQYGFSAVYQNKEENGAGDVEVKVDHGRALGIFAGTDRCNNRGDAGTDILTHDNRESGRESYSAGGGKCLKYTDRCRRTLYQSGEYRTCDNTEDGIGKSGHKFGEVGGIFKGRDRLFHREHAREKYAEADEYLTKLLAGGLVGYHKEKYADKRREGSEVCGLKEQQQQAVTFKIGETDKLCGDGGTDIGAHYNAYRLLKLKYTGVYKTYDDNGGGRGALDNCGGNGTEQYAGDDVSGKGAEHFFHFTARNLFETVAHNVHSVKEQRNASAE